MLFEYDPTKSNANLEKHGIDFEEAQDLWLGEVLTLKSNLKGGEQVQGHRTDFGRVLDGVFHVPGIAPQDYLVETRNAEGKGRI